MEQSLMFLETRVCLWGCSLYLIIMWCHPANQICAFRWESPLEWDEMRDISRESLEISESGRSIFKQCALNKRKVKSENELLIKNRQILPCFFFLTGSSKPQSLICSESVECVAPRWDRAQSFWANIPTPIQTEVTKNKHTHISDLKSMLILSLSGQEEVLQWDIRGREREKHVLKLFSC